jgi:hypothetical protein
VVYASDLRDLPAPTPFDWRAGVSDFLHEVWRAAMLAAWEVQDGAEAAPQPDPQSALEMRISAVFEGELAAAREHPKTRDPYARAAHATLARLEAAACEKPGPWLHSPVALPYAMRRGLGVLHEAVDATECRQARATGQWPDAKRPHRVALLHGHRGGILLGRATLMSLIDLLADFRAALTSPYFTRGDVSGVEALFPDNLGIA